MGAKKLLNKRSDKLDEDLDLDIREKFSKFLEI